MEETKNYKNKFGQFTIKYMDIPITSETFKTWKWMYPGTESKTIIVTRIIITILTRILYFIPVTIILFISYNKKFIMSVWDFIIYGGGWITHNKIHNNKTIADVYLKLNEFIIKQKVKEYEEKNKIKPEVGN